MSSLPLKAFYLWHDTHVEEGWLSTSSTSHLYQIRYPSEAPSGKLRSSDPRALRRGFCCASQSVPVIGKWGFENDSNKTKKFFLFLIKKNGPVSGCLLSRLQVLSLDQTRWSWTHQPSCSNQRTQTAVCTGSMPSSLSGHKACQRDHGDGCPAANSLWDFLDTPDRMHSGCQQEKLKHETQWEYRKKETGG